MPIQSASSLVEKHMTRMLCPELWPLLLIVALTSCAAPGPLPTASYPYSFPSTRATLHLGEKELADGRFVGLAISGGGSRAAVFGGAVLKELERIGVLQQVDVISAVSGGALPAAYYALDGYGTIDFSNGFMEQMGRDFQNEVRARWLSPGKVLKYWFTSSTKSDTVVEILDRCSC